MGGYMKTIRNKNEDLSEMLKELKIGDIPIYDTVSNYEITKVPGGFIYKNEYSGLCFVPDVPQPAKKTAPATIDNIPGSVAKVGRPRKIDKEIV